MTGPTSALTVSSRVHARLRADILSGFYGAGDALPSERRLSEELETSRHAIREALKRLQQAGLVSISQGGATRVRDWRHHGGLELLLEGDLPEALQARRAAMEMRASIGADAARRAAQRGDATLKAQVVARAGQLAAVDDLAARNAHYEVLWDLIVEAADNIAYRLALTTLLARDDIAPVGAEAVRGELEDVGAIAALAAAIAAGDAEGALSRARELLERSAAGASVSGGGAGALGGAEVAGGGDHASGGAEVVAGGAGASGGAEVAGGGDHASGGAEVVAGGAGASGGAEVAGGGDHASGGAEVVAGGAEGAGSGEDASGGGAAALDGAGG